MSELSSRVGAIIAAAGSSQRLGGTDKISLVLGGKPLLAWAVDTCQDCVLIQQIVLVLSDKNIELGRKLAAERTWSKVTEICLGGKRRQDSVGIGLKKLKGCDWVLVHDGARPFLTTALIRNGLEAAVSSGAAVAAVPANDTIKISKENGFVAQTLPRQRVWLVQTPQIFRFDIIDRAYQQLTEEVTDDATLVERLGYEVKIYPGSYYNIKVTTPEDLALAELIRERLSQKGN